MTTTIDPELDLRWYFVDAPTECGVCSAMGRQLDRMEAFSCTQPPMGGTCMSGRISVRKTKPAARPGDAEIQERQLDAARRANTIAARLRRLTPRQQVVLERQFSSKERLDGKVSLGLACAQKVAQDGYLAHRMVVARISDPEKRKRRTADSETMIMWLSYVYRNAKDGPAQREILDAIMASAERELADALRAYGRVVG